MGWGTLGLVNLGHDVSCVALFCTALSLTLVVGKFGDCTCLLDVVLPSILFLVSGRSFGAVEGEPCALCVTLSYMTPSTSTALQLCRPEK